MIIKIDKRGAFTIPKIIRDALNIQGGDNIKMEIVDDKLIITKPKNK